MTGRGFRPPALTLNTEDKDMSEYHDRLRAHEKAQEAFAAEYERSHGPPEKRREGATEDKMLRPTDHEDKADTGVVVESVDVDALSKAELVALAEERGVEVTREDGRTDLGPTASDYRKALG